MSSKAGKNVFPEPTPMTTSLLRLGRHGGHICLHDLTKPYTHAVIFGMYKFGDDPQKLSPDI